MLRNSLQRRLRMEVLEDKRPLAANLFVSVVRGDLIITGDAGDNRFYIESGSPDGAQYEIGNLGNFADKINGVPFNSTDHFFSGVTGNIIINLGDGNDHVNVRGSNGVTVLNMPGDLRINMGSGDDRIVLGTGEAPLVDFPMPDVAYPLNITKNLIIDMGAGNDKTWVASTKVGGDFRYTDSQGDNFLMFVPQSAFMLQGRESEIGRDFLVSTGGGVDELSLEDINVGRDMVLSVGGGDDFVGVFNVDVAGSTVAHLGSGVDRADLQVSNLGKSLTVLGSDSNFVTVIEVITSQSVKVHTSNGYDEIVLIGVQTGTATITTGPGADQLFIIDSVFDHLLVNLGGGNDTLTIGGTTVNGLALLLGGGGFDTLVNLGDNEFGLALALAFESWGA